MLLQEVEQLLVLDARHLQHFRCAIADVALVQGPQEGPVRTHTMTKTISWIGRGRANSMILAEAGQTLYIGSQ